MSEQDENDNGVETEEETQEEGEDDHGFPTVKEIRGDPTERVT